jgi:ABC-type multidrug transport system ATPase subunit
MNIEIAGLTKTFGRDRRALRGVDLEIPAGMYGLLGPNGAGKTTFMRILAAILRPSSGSVIVNGHDAATGRGRLAIKRGLGYLPQDLGLYPDLSAPEFLDYVALLKGMSDRRHRSRRIGELLELVNLESAGRRKLGGFSGGMKRRVGIAQALLADPELLIVDEPTAGLDPEERLRFRNLLVQLGGQRTVLLSTHIVDDIAQTCRRLAVLAAGRILFHGSTADLVGAASGSVWLLDTEGPHPATAATVVSATPHAAGMRYRLLCPEAPHPDAAPVDATLEDGYLALMHQPQVAGAA